MIDTLLWIRQRVNEKPPELPAKTQALKETPFVLITGHRRESFGQGCENIYLAIRQVADDLADVQFVYPMHRNPNVREPVNRILAGHDRIHLIEPLTYEPFVWLMDQATVILTDSGGVQEEAPSLGIPVLAMRETTERPDGVEAGNAKLIGTHRDTIVAELKNLLTDPDA